MAYTHPSKLTSLGSNGEINVDPELLKKAYYYLKEGTKLFKGWINEVADDHEKFTPINLPGQIRRKTRLFAKASEFFNKTIGELAKGQNILVVSRSENWFYVRVGSSTFGYVLANTVFLRPNVDIIEEVIKEGNQWKPFLEKTYVLSLSPNWELIEGPKNSYPKSTVFYHDTSNGELIYLTFDPEVGNVTDSNVYGFMSDYQPQDIAEINTKSELPIAALAAGAAALYLLSR